MRPRETKSPLFCTPEAHILVSRMQQRTSVWITNTRVVYILQRIPYSLPTLGTNVRIQPKKTKILSWDPIQHEEKRSDGVIPRSIWNPASQIPWESGEESATQATGLGGSGDLGLEVNTNTKRTDQGVEEISCRTHIL